MPRTTHHQRIARGLAKATHLTYQQALDKVTAAAAAGLLPSPLDRAGVARAVEMLASRQVAEYVSIPAVASAAPFDGVFDQPHGLVLVTGSVLSGKTTLLYDTALRLAAEGLDVVTIEDPIERRLVTAEGATGSIRQVEAAPTEAFLGDPDVVILGELRRREDVEVAAHLAYSGHLVVAGFHAHSAEESIHRVVNMHPNYPMQEQRAAREWLADTLVAVIETRREDGHHHVRSLVIDDAKRERIRTGAEPLMCECGVPVDEHGSEIDDCPGVLPAPGSDEARLANIRTGHPPLGHEFWGVAGHPDDDECTHREDGTDATYCGLTADEHGYLGEEWDLLTEVLEAQRYDTSDLGDVLPPLTREEFEPGATVINGIAFHDSEDATIFSWGHIDKATYAEVVNAYSASTALPSDLAVIAAETPAADLVSIRHAWAVNTRPVDGLTGWWLRWDHAITQDTPGAFAITLAEY